MTFRNLSVTANGDGNDPLSPSLIFILTDDVLVSGKRDEGIIQ